MATDRPTEQLIVDLAGDLRPVTGTASTSTRFFGWLLTAAAAVAVGAVLIGARHDLANAVQTRAMIWPLGAGLVAALTAAVAALRLSIPAGDSSGRGRLWAVLAALAWPAMLWSLSAASGRSVLAEPFHPACGIRVVTLAMVPSFLLMRQLAQGFVLNTVQAWSVAVLGGSALAATAVQLVCPIDRPAHLIVAHVLPAALLVALAALIAKALSTRSTSSTPSPY